MTYVSQVQEFMGTCLSKVRVLKKKQTDQHIYLIPPNSRYIKTVSRERKPINIPKTTSSLTLPESVWDGPSLPGHGLATPGFLGWQEKRKELVR